VIAAMKRRYLGLLAAPMLLANCQPACTPAPPAPFASTTTTSTTVAEPVYDWELAVQCDDEGDGELGAYITTIGTADVVILAAMSSRRLDVGATVFIPWQYDQGDLGTPLEEMSFKFVAADHFEDFGTIVIWLADFCDGGALSG
jgi:hypothetical protein